MRNATIQSLVQLGDQVLDNLDSLSITWNELHEWGPNQFETMLKEHSIEDIVRLTKSLVLLDTVKKFSSGSVAPAIWVFKILEDRNYSDLLSLAEWVDKVSDNSYLPFGTQSFREDRFAMLRSKRGE
jgi:hypothetical protein